MTTPCEQQLGLLEGQTHALWFRGRLGHRLEQSRVDGIENRALVGRQGLAFELAGDELEAKILVAAGERGNGIANVTDEWELLVTKGISNSPKQLATSQF
jgi:hypothetical protein